MRTKEKKQYLPFIAILLLFLAIVSACTKKSFAVIFVVDGETYETITTDGKSEITFPKEPKKDGYVFFGWYFDENVWENTFIPGDGKSLSLSSNITVFAKWGVHVHTFSAEFIIDKEPTDTEPGSKSKHCTKCGEKSEVTEIPQLRDNRSLKELFEENHTILRKSLEPAVKKGNDNSILKMFYTEDSQYLDSFGYIKTAVVIEFKETILPVVFEVLPYESCSNSYKKKTTEGVHADLVSGKGETKKCKDCDRYTQRAEPYIFSIMHGKYVEENGFILSTDKKELLSVVDMPEDYSAVIPEGVTRIGSYAFQYRNNLKNVTLPASLENTGFYVFNFCNNLESVTVSKGSRLTSIGAYIFYNCPSLVRVQLPDGLINIGAHAFWECSSLADITIPDSVTVIGEWAFLGCTSLTRIVMPSGITKIEASTFKNCSKLKEVVISDNTVSIGQHAFLGCIRLATITIPASVTEIKAGAFAECSSLSIKAEAFVQPSGWVDGWMWSDCTVTWDCTNNDIGEDGFIHFVAENGIGYALRAGIASVEKQKATLSGKIEIPSIITYKGRTYTVTTIDSEAFQKCNLLQSIVLPSSITKIGKYAFAACLGLTTITISANVENMGESVFIGCTSLTIYLEKTAIPIGWGNWNLSGCPVVLDSKNNQTASDGYIYYIADNGVRYALKDGNADLARQGTCLAGEIEVLSRVQYKNQIYQLNSTIKDNTFKNCTDLTGITLPSGVSNLGASIFSGCSKLAQIAVPNSVNSIGESAFYKCSSLVRIAIPSAVTVLESALFRGCTKLASITISSAVTSIGAQAFAECSGLTSITISSAVTSIGAFAFEGCSSLTSVTIPSAVTSIGAGAFGGCSKLTSISVESGNQRYSSKGNCLIDREHKTLIAGCKSSTIPTDGSVTKIDKKAFYGCSGLTSVIIPSSVTSIDESAFEGNSLTSITIPSSVTNIGKYAFYQNRQLIVINYDGTVTQWKKITKDVQWARFTGDFKVICKDGELNKTEAGG